MAAAGRVTTESSALFGQTMLGLATTLENVDAIEQEGGLSLILSSFHVRAPARPTFCGRDAWSLCVCGPRVQRHMC